MPATVSPKTFTARIPNDVYEASREVAEQRGVSMNALVQEGLSRIIHDAQERAFFDSFTLLGQDAEMSDVEFAFDAQSEVVGVA